MDFRSWLISQGKEVFMNTLENPDSLVDVTIPKEDGYYHPFFEIFAYLPSNVFEEKTGKDIDDYDSSTGNHPELDLDWSEDDLEGIKKTCPNLFDKYWEKD